MNKRQGCDNIEQSTYEQNRIKRLDRFMASLSTLKQAEVEEKAKIKAEKFGKAKYSVQAVRRARYEVLEEMENE